MLSFAEFRGFIVLTLTSEALEAEGGGARIDENSGLAKVGPTKIEVWRMSARRFPYFSEARIHVFPTFLNVGSTISLLF